MKKLVLLLNLVFFLIASNSYSDDFVRKTTWVTSDLITASKLNADPDETARVLGTISNGLISNGNVKATAAITESKVLFSASAGHNHDGIDSKIISNDTVTSAIITDNEIVNADVNASADIVSSKIAFSVSGWDIDGTTVTSSATELNLLTGVTGTVVTEATALGGDLTGTLPNPGAKASNVFFSWCGHETYSANNYGLNISATLNLDISANDAVGYVNYVIDDSTYQTFLNFKFKKPVGVDTITIYARIWARTAEADEEAVLNVNIGGASNTVTSTITTSPAWATASDIDVSGLVDGTVYDGIVQLKNEKDTFDAYCSAVTLIGS